MVRQFTMDGMEFLGLQIDKTLNTKNATGERDISRKNSPAKIFVIPTNEELVIALDTRDIIKSM